MGSHPTAQCVPRWPIYVPKTASFHRSSKSPHRKVVFVRGRLSATDLLQLRQVDTIAGRTVPIDRAGSAMSFGSADIIKTNLVAGNGVVHFVDGLNL